MAPIDTTSAMHLVPMPAEETAPQYERPNTLNGLLQALVACDEGMQDLSLDEQVDLIEGGKVKVDNYKYLIDHLEAQEALFQKWEDEYKAARKAVESNAKRLKLHMVYALQTNGFQKFTGNQYVVKLAKAAPSVEVKGEPTAKLKVKYDSYIRVKYEWDKKAIGAGLKSGDPLAVELGSLRETVYAKFDIIKGV